MSTFNCSKCQNLKRNELDGKIFCKLGIVAIPLLRVEGDDKLCESNFKPLPDGEQWHEEFYWESEKNNENCSG